MAKAKILLVEDNATQAYAHLGFLLPEAGMKLCR